jgi:hypothetical protein
MGRGLERPLAQLLDEYAIQAAHTDEIVASCDWDTESVAIDGDTGKPIALRYIITHLIEETARHNGHRYPPRTRRWRHRRLTRS